MKNAEPADPFAGQKRDFRELWGLKLRTFKKKGTKELNNMYTFDERINYQQVKQLIYISIPTYIVRNRSFMEIFLFFFFLLSLFRNQLTKQW